MKKRGGGGGKAEVGDEEVELSELAKSHTKDEEEEEDDDEENGGDNVATELDLQLKARFLNKTNATVCVLWHLIPIIVMVYAFLYIGTPPPPNLFHFSFFENKSQ
jgi:hypothetical protein